MSSRNLSRTIYVTASLSTSGTVWSVWEATETHQVYAGPAARARAVQAALRLAEALRTEGTVHVLVGPEIDGARRTDDDASSPRLAS